MSVYVRNAGAAIVAILAMVGPAAATPLLSLTVSGGAAPLVLNSTPGNDISYTGTYATADGTYTLVLGASGDDASLTLTVLVSRVTKTPDPITV